MSGCSHTLYDHTNKVVATGVLEEVGNNPSSGDNPYRIDLSSVPVKIP
jgi:hypothetical protein